MLEFAEEALNRVAQFVEGRKEAALLLPVRPEVPSALTLSNNNLKVVTFNYDRSFEEAFAQILRKIPKYHDVNRAGILGGSDS